jgi:hypothetical protein
MLENITLIASAVSGLAAVTTSLRAIGVSREYSRTERESQVKSSCSVGCSKPAPPASQRSSLKLHLFVTAVWYILSVIFALPSLTGQETGSGLILWLLPFVLLAAVLIVIWHKFVIARN